MNEVIIKKAAPGREMKKTQGCMQPNTLSSADLGICDGHVMMALPAYAGGGQCGNTLRSWKERTSKRSDRLLQRATRAPVACCWGQQVDLPESKRCTYLDLFIYNL